VPLDLFTTREIASAFWLAALAAIVVAVPRLRPLVGGVARALLILLQPWVALLLGLFFGWLAFAIWIASHVPLWNSRLLVEAVLWAAVQGFALLASIGEMGEPGFFRRQLGRVVGITAFLLFYLHIITFPLVVEIALQPLSALLGVMALAARRTENETWTSRLLAAFGFLLIVATAANLATNFGQIDWARVGFSWLLPLWLTVMAIPAVYLLNVIDQYRVLFRLADMDARPRGWRARIRARLALLLGYGVNARELAVVRRYLGTIGRVAIAPNLSAALAEIADLRAMRRAETDAERQRVEDLKTYSGVKGTDEEGRQLDRREFEETTGALNTLAVRQMGWYRNRGGRYRREVLELMGHHHALERLPAHHGIKMRVRRDGQAWYAWRRTPSGWVFAIGAHGPPPAQSHYDGPTLPKGYPGEWPGWKDVPGANWL